MIYLVNISGCHIRDTLDPSPRGLEDEGLHLYLASGALLRAPTSFSSCDRLGGAIRVAPTGRDFDVRPGGDISVAPAGLLFGVSSSGRYNTALAGVTSTLPFSG